MMNLLIGFTSCCVAQARPSASVCDRLGDGRREVGACAASLAARRPEFVVGRLDGLRKHPEKLLPHVGLSVAAGEAFVYAGQPLRACRATRGRERTHSPGAPRSSASTARERAGRRLTADAGELLEAYAGEHHVGPAPIEDIPGRDTRDRRRGARVGDDARGTARVGALRQARDGRRVGPSAPPRTARGGAARPRRAGSAAGRRATIPRAARATGSTSSSARCSARSPPRPRRPCPGHRPAGDRRSFALWRSHTSSRPLVAPVHARLDEAKRPTTVSDASLSGSDRHDEASIVGLKLAAGNADASWCCAERPPCARLGSACPDASQPR